MPLSDEDKEFLTRLAITHAVVAQGGIGSWSPMAAEAFIRTSLRPAPGRDVGLNIPACLAYPKQLIFELGVEVTKITAVYDRGMALVIDTDPLALLLDLKPGHARVAPASGTIRLGAPPMGPVTADVIRGKDNLPPPYIFRPNDLAGGVTAERRAELARLGLLEEARAA